MVFDPMKFYDDGQRKQKRYDTLIPNIVAAVVLLVVFYGFFVAYQRSHVKPKPVAPALVIPKPVHDTEFTCPSEPNDSDEGCNNWRNQTTVAQSSTTWYRCSDGVTVTGDLKNCPEYAGSGGTKVLDVGHEPFMKDEFSYSKKTPRKHKRKADVMHFTAYYESPASYNPHAHLTLQQLKQYQQENPSPICILNIIGECWVTLDPDPKPDCLPGGSVKGDIPPCGDVQVGDGGDRHVMGTTESKPNCDDPAGEGFCPFRRDMPEALSCCDGREPGLVISNKRQTTPQDITNLMEQIAPTAKQERKPCPGGCDDGWDVEEGSYACVQDGLRKPPSQKSCAEQGLKAAKWPTSATAQIVLTQKQKDAYPGNAWMKPCGPDNYSGGCYTPDCKMPADVDVCPQTLDPKAVDDKKAKP